MEIVPYGGWDRCARMVSGDTELVVTLDVGPRIIRYGFIGGENEFFENPRDRGAVGGSAYRGYGGHRLWIAPEDRERSYTPDNEAVEFGDQYFRSAPDRFGIQKEIRIFPSPKPPPRAQSIAERESRGSGLNTAGFRIEHVVHNEGAEPVELAAWALTVMAPGGECVFPQAVFRPHSESLLPVRPLVLWSYTDMADPRWTWGKRVVRLRHDPNLGPQKIGALVKEGIAAYANRGRVFLKHFEYLKEAVYPDMGCNFETFTRHDMLEVESLGPLQVVEPGSSVSHWESWSLFEEAPPSDDEECGEWLRGLISLADNAGLYI